MLKLFLLFLVAIPIAIVLGVGLFVVFGLLLALRNRIGISRERPPISTVRAYFADRYPTSSIAYVRLAANETDRDVVCVFYDLNGTRPPRCKCFTVSYDTDAIAELDDCRQYTPRHHR